MVISTINQTLHQSVLPFGSFNGSSSASVTSVISNDKPSNNEQTSVIKTPKFLINDISNGQSALKAAKKTVKSPKPDTSKQFLPSFATLGSPEFDCKKKGFVPTPCPELKGASVGAATAFARRLPCTFEPEKPLPPIFSIFD